VNYQKGAFLSRYQEGAGVEPPISRLVVKGSTTVLKAIKVDFGLIPNFFENDIKIVLMYFLFTAPGSNPIKLYEC